MSYDSWKLSTPPEYEQDRWDSLPEEEPPEPQLRVVGYISGSRQKRATVWDNLDGTVSVVVDCKSVVVFSDVAQADCYAATYAFGPQARMG